MTTLATLVVRITADTTDYQTKLKAVSDIGKKISDVGGKLTKAVTLPLIAVGTYSVYAASKLEHMRDQVETIFGSSAKMVEDFGKTAATSFGLSNRAADEATTTFGAMFTNLGLGTGAAAKMSINLTGLAADMAQFRDASPEEMLSSLQGALVGRGMDLKKFGIDLSDATVQAKAMAMGIGGVGGKLSEAQAVQVRYALIMEQTAKIQGTFANSTGGLGVKLKTMKASLENAAAAIGEKLLPYATKAVDGITRMVTAFTNLPVPVQNTVVVIAALAAATGPVLTIFGKLITFGSGVVGFFQKLIPFITANIAVLGPLAIALAAVVAVGIAYNDLNKKTEAGVKSVQTAWGGFFKQQITQGKSATEIAAAYAEKTAEANQIFNGQKDILGKVAVAWIKLRTDESKFLTDQAGLKQALMLTSKSADEYASAMLNGAEISGNFKGNPSTFYDQAKAEWEATNGIPPLVDQEGKLTDVGTVLTETMKNVTSAITSMNLPTGESEKKIEDLQIALNMLNPAQAQVSKDTELMAKGYATNAVSLERMTTFMKTATMGISDLTDAERAQLTIQAALSDLVSRASDEISQFTPNVVEATQKITALKVATGLLTPEQGKQLVLQAKLNSDTDLITQGYLANAISLDRMTAFLKTAATGTSDLTDAERKQITALIAVNEKMKQTVSLSDTYAMLAQAASDLGVSDQNLSDIQDVMQTSVGGLSDELNTTTTDMQLMAEATFLGIKTTTQYGLAMHDAANGSFELSAAERASISASVEAAKAQREKALAVQSAAQSYLELSASLKGATNAQIAQTAIDELGKLKESGKLDFGTYFTAVSGVQEAFGLSDEKSRALASAMPLLNDALMSGVLPATNYDDALKAVIKDSGDGVVNVDAILTKFGAMPESTTTATDALNTFNQTITTVPQTAAAAAQQTYDAFITPNWANAGVAAGQKIADGITSTTPVIVAAAEAAVKAAIKAAEAITAGTTPTAENPPEKPGYAEGGSGVVPQGYPNDSYLMGLTSGETFTITPEGGGGNNTSITVPIIVYGNADPEKIKTAAREGVLAAQRAMGKR